MDGLMIIISNKLVSNVGKLHLFPPSGIFIVMCHLFYSNQVNTLSVILGGIVRLKKHFPKTRQLIQALVLNAQIMTEKLFMNLQRNEK